MSRSEAKMSTWYRDAPEELRPHLLRSNHIVGSYLDGLSFIIQDTTRDPSYLENHLLSYLSNDLIESSIAILTLISQGAKSVARRELRFIIEASLKICFVQQGNYQSTIQEKLAEFDSVLSSQRISIKNDLKLHMLNEELQSAFSDEVGRMYGALSNIVHLSPQQIQNRITDVEAGASLGRESVESAIESNSLLEQTLTFSLVLLFHSVPEWVTGDLLVEADGASFDWHFSESKYVTQMDSYFDYKHERKQKLSDVLEARKTKVRF